MSAYPLSKSILLLGDSLTQGGVAAGGYSQLLQEAYIRKLDVINRGFGGYNASWLLEIAKQIVASSGTKGLTEVALVIVFIGANDAVDAKLNPRQHVPLDVYPRKVEEILKLFPSTTPKILITPPPVQPDRFAEIINAAKPDRALSVTHSYAKAIIQLGQDLKVPVVDLFEEFNKIPETEWDSLFTDGLHLTAAGYQLLYAALISVIKTSYPKLDPEQMAMVFPTWDAVDLSDLTGSLRYKE